MNLRSLVFMAILLSISTALVYKDEGKIYGNYSNSSVEIIVFDSSTGGKIIDRFFTKTNDFNSWKLEEETSKMKLDELYWKEYIVKGTEVDWGVKKRERKPIFSTLNPLLKKLGEWVWDIQLFIDSIEQRLDELSFIVVKGDRAIFSKPISLQQGEVVNNIISYPQNVDPEKTLVTKKYVDSLISNSKTEVERIINNISYQDNDTFLNLADTPSSYSGEGGKFLMVRNDEKGITFRSISTSFPSIPSHNQLSGLQGGNSSDRYHLTSQEHSNLVSNMPFNDNSIVFVNKGALDSDKYLTWNNGTLALNKTSFDNTYALDVGGHINAVPVCAKYTYKEEYPISSKNLFVEFEGKFASNNLKSSNLFSTRDTEPLPKDILNETLVIEKSGYYTMTLTFVLMFESVSSDFIGKLDFIVNGKTVKTYPIQIPSNKIIPYTHAVTVSELLYFDKGDELKIAFSYSAGKPARISNFKEGTFTSFFICKVN